MFLQRNFKLVVLLLSIIYLVGIFGLSLSVTAGLFQQLIPFTILLSSLLVALYSQPVSLKYNLLAAFVLISGWGLEAIGTNTGLLFGEYTYGKSLGFKILGTPAIMAFNWYMLIFIIWAIINSIQKLNLFLKIVTGSFIMVIYDLILEPVAIHLDMWSWADGIPPLQNYLAWFIISFFLFSVIALSKLRFKNRLALPMLVIQFVFFLILMILIKTT